jgi:hypothetical protein
MRARIRASSSGSPHDIEMVSIEELRLHITSFPAGSGAFPAGSGALATAPPATTRTSGTASRREGSQVIRGTLPRRIRQMRRAVRESTAPGLTCPRPCHPS